MAKQKRQWILARIQVIVMSYVDIDNMMELALTISKGLLSEHIVMIARNCMVKLRSQTDLDRVSK